MNPLDEASPRALQRVVSRVSLRIAFAMMPVLVMVLSVFGVAGALREGEVVELEMQRDADAVAASVVSLVDPRKPDLIDQIARLDLDLPHLSIRLLPPDDALNGKVAGQVTARAGLRDAQGVLLGVIEVTEPLAERDEFVLRALLTDAVGVLVATLIATSLAVAVGRTVVERRVDAVIQRLSAVGRGELPDKPLALGSDELGVLGRAVNDMIDELQTAQENARAELEARRRAQLHLRRADRLAAVGRTTAVFAHELGTPLAVVSGRAERLLRNPVDEAVARNALAIRDQAERMTVSLRRLLDYARHDDGLQLRPTRLHEILEHAATLVAERATQAHVRVHVPDLPVRTQVDADPQALMQVFTNLLNNAIDASPIGSDVRIDVRLAACTLGDGRQLSDPHLHVVVSDRGPGIPEDLRGRVFDPFFTTKPAGEGTGLGLAIVQEIVQDHGGLITLADHEGGGLQVVVHLPCLEARDG